MPELDPSLSFSEFDAVTYARWRAAAEKALGATLASVTAAGVAPLLPDDDRPPGSRALWDDGGWRVGQELTSVTPEPIAAALLESRGGLDVAAISVESTARAGCRSSNAGRGARLDRADELAPIVRAARDTGIDVVLHADAAAPMLLAAWRELEPKAEGLAGVVADPLGTLAELGARGCTLRDAYAVLARTTRDAIALSSSAPKPPLATVLADGVPYHDAGTTPAFALGAAIAAALSHLRGLADNGIAPAEAAPHVVLRLALGTRLLETIATLRAARLVWGACLRKLGAHDHQPGSQPRIWARTSWRHGSRLDLPVNLLRHTLQAFAASIGGVEHLYVQPHTEPCGRDDADARRWARNIQHLLRGESRLDVVADPSAGSSYIEHLTRAIAATAWDVARELSTPDPEGALLAALQPDAPLLRRHAARPDPMVGVDLHPTQAPPSPRAHASGGGPARDDSPVVSAPALPRARIAEPHEIEHEEGGA